MERTEVHMCKLNQGVELGKAEDEKGLTRRDILTA